MICPNAWSASGASRVVTGHRSSGFTNANRSKVMPSRWRASYGCRRDR
jgi:hypothetical protein